MEPQLYRQFQSELLRWCRGENLDVNHAMLVVGVSEDARVIQIEDALHTVRCWGRVRVRGRIFIREADGLIVLCESREDIDPLLAPPEVRIPDSEVVWGVVMATQIPVVTNVFFVKLRNLLREEGKTVSDLKSFCVPPG